MCVALERRSNAFGEVTPQRSLVNRSGRRTPFGQITGLVVEFRRVRWTHQYLGDDA